MVASKVHLSIELLTTLIIDSFSEKTFCIFINAAGMAQEGNVQTYIELINVQKHLIV